MMYYSNSPNRYQYKAENYISQSPSKSLPKLYITYYSSLLTISPYMPSFSPKKEKIEKSFSAILKVEGDNSKLYFLLGFVLIEKIAFSEQRRSEHIAKLVEDSLEEIRRHPKTTSEEKILLNDVKKNFKSLIAECPLDQFQNVDKLKWIRKKADEAQFDKDMTLCIVQIARCSLINYLIRNNLHYKYHAVFQDMIDKFQTVDGNLGDHILGWFSSCFNIKITNYYLFSTNIDEVIYGKHETDETFLIESTRFIGILYSGSPRKSSGDLQLKTLVDDKIGTPSKLSEVMKGLNSRYKREEPPQNLYTDKYSLYSPQYTTPISSTPIKTTQYYTPPSKPVVERESLERPAMIRCNMCENDLPSDYVYSNTYCVHSFCYNCLKVISEEPTGIYFCFSCNKTVDTRKLKEFYDTCKFIEKQEQAMLPEEKPQEKVQEKVPEKVEEKVDEKPQEKAPEAQQVSPEGKIKPKGETKILLEDKECQKCHTTPEDKNLYTAKECQHSFCRECLSKSVDNSNYKCLQVDCGKILNKTEVNTFLGKSPEKPSPPPVKLKNCDICKGQFDEKSLFVNRKCHHSYCTDCIDRRIFTLCPVSRCYERADKNETARFQDHLLISQFNDVVEMKTVDCTQCGTEFEISLTNNVNPEYWKCIKCKACYCGKHNDLMEKCLCMCPDCLSTLREVHRFFKRNCKKCPNSYCIKCNKPCDKATGKLTCNCAEEFKSKEVVVPADKEEMMKKSEGTLDLINQCDSCMDFSDEPEFVKLECNHRICEVCVLKNNDERAKEIRCHICRN